MANKYLVLIISETMTQYPFLFTHANLPATSCEEPLNNTKKYWKVQSVVEIVRNRCRALEQAEFNITDEQMIPFPGRCPAPQYVKCKPNPVRIKTFVLYQGVGTEISPQYSHLGLGGSIVMQLAKNILRQKHFKIFLDNFFTSIALISALKSSGMPASGVMKSNRMTGAALKSKKAMQKLR